MTSSSVSLTSPPRWQQWIRYGYCGMAVLLALAIILQVFFAGTAVLVSPTYWPIHRSFAHGIEMMTFGLLLIGLISRLPWRIQRLGLLFYGLTFLQYVFLYYAPKAGFPMLRAFHAVNALALFSVALLLTMRTWRYLKS